MTAKKSDGSVGEGEALSQQRVKVQPRRQDRPLGGTQPSQTVGGEFERRVARLEFAEGAFVRLRVPVTADDADPGRDVVTDIDVMSIDIDSRLRLSRSALECKTGEGQSGEPYTLVWLAGFQQLLDLDRAVLVRQTVSSRGRSLARRLRLSILDNATLQGRERAHEWVPSTFAHVDGAACLAAERRTDVQLKGLPQVPSQLANFLRHEALHAPSHRLLGAVAAYGAAVGRQGGVPEPAASVLAGHGLIGTLLAALQDAGRLDSFPPQLLRERLIRGLTVGHPDDSSLLRLLDRADDLIAHFQRRTHQAYVENGAEPIALDVPSLRELVAQPPDYLDDYLDFVVRLRDNPQIARDLLRTAELVCFEALVGAPAWQAPAFAHLFTTEHKALLLVAVRCLARIAGEPVGLALAGIANLPFEGSGGRVPDRHTPAPSPAPSTQNVVVDESRADQPMLPEA